VKEKVFSEMFMKNCLLRAYVKMLINMEVLFVVKFGRDIADPS